MRPLLAWLSRLFPAAFREQFGADIVEQVEVDYERARRRGRARVLLFFCATALDLVRSAVAERFDPAWTSCDIERTRGEDVRMSMTAWKDDFRRAVRSLARSPGFAVVTAATIALAIGANAGIFSVVDTVLLDPLPFRDAERLVYIGASAPGSDLPPEFGVASEFYLQYREHSELLEDIAIYNSFTSTLRAGDRTERIRMSTPTASLFSTLGATPVIGRLPVPEDEGDVAVLSHALWTSWFGADPEIVGRSYYVSGRERTVIGVMGPDFWFPNDETMLWFPSVVRTEDLVPGRFGLPIVARVAPDVSHQELVEELEILARSLPERVGGTADYARLIEQHRAVVRPLEEELLGRLATPLWVLLGSVGIVLLIACANVANLFLVRTERRQRDLAIARALGAGRSQLVRAQMAEALVVAILAGALALVLARLSVPILVEMAPAQIPRLDEVAITGSTLLFTLGLTLLAALLFGLLPAVRASAPSLTRLREGGRGSTRRSHWGRAGLVVVQTALALVLLIGSALLVRSFWKLRDVDPGYDTEDIFTFQIAPETNLADAPSFARFHMGFMERLRVLPGVESVGVVENVPLDEGVARARFRTETMASGTDVGPLLGFTWTAGDYFEAMGIELLAGRVFTDADHVSQLGNVVISRSGADTLWPSQDPIGRRLQHQDLKTWETVVGVVEDVLQDSFRDTPQPLVYFPLVGRDSESWMVSSPAYVVKTHRAEEIAPEVRALVREVAPEAPMYRVYTMAGLASDSMVQLSFTMLTLGIASLLALLIGAIGLYGLLSYVVAERRQEIGVRVALGAAPRRVELMVVAQGARLVVFGVVFGVAAAIGMTRAIGSLLYGVEAVDAGTFAGVSATMVLMGLLATYMPARRASRLDPIRSLMSE